jgi:endonuclease G, mitochondrial
MSRPDAERIKSYLQLISGKEGLERLLETVSPPGDGGLEMAESRVGKAARTGMESVLLGREPSDDQLAGLEALIIPKLRPAVDIVDGKFQVTHELWTHLSTNEAIRKRIEDVIPSVAVTKGRTSWSSAS